MDRADGRASTRREVIRQGLAVGAAASTSAVAGMLIEPGRAAAAGDADALVPLVGTELLAAFGYKQVLDAHVLSRRGDRLARRILSQEHAHIATLTRELTRLGGTPPPPVTSVAAADKVLSAAGVSQRLGDLHSAHDAILLLSRFELLLEAAYIQAIKEFQSAQLLRLGGQIIANEAQHGTMLSELLHPGDVKKAVPSSNVLGAGA